MHVNKSTVRTITGRFVRVLIFVSLATWYESSSDGTNNPKYEQSRKVRIVLSTNSTGYEKSREGTNSSMVRTVQGTNSPSMVRIVQGTNIVQGTKRPGTEKITLQWRLNRRKI